MTAAKSYLLTDAQLQQFFQDGFLIVENFFTEDELQVYSNYFLFS
jgi:hypothetical protein